MSEHPDSTDRRLAILKKQLSEDEVICSGCLQIVNENSLCEDCSNYLFEPLCERCCVCGLSNTKSYKRTKI